MVTGTASVPAAEPAAGTGVPVPAAEVASRVVDPEMPMLTLAELGVLRSVQVHGEHRDEVTVLITPTYTGCPAVEEMRHDLHSALTGAGYRRVQVRTVLSPPWSTDRISEAGLRKLAEAGIAPPGRIGPRPGGPVPLTLAPPPARVSCPRCGAEVTEQLSGFGPTACTALRRCTSCLEPFQHMKEI